MRRRLALAALLCAAAAAHAQPRRDPFSRPPAAALAPQPAAADAPEAAEPAPLRLRAVILNGARSLANIDGDIVAIGERGPDYRVLRIDARGVLVERAGQQQLLTLNEKEKQ